MLIDKKCQTDFYIIICSNGEKKEKLLKWYLKRITWQFLKSEPDTK